VATTHERPASSAPEVRRGPARWLWLLGGFLSVGIGAIGVVIPGLPTTVFFIVAAWCFARSSPRFEAWVLGLPKIGPMVRDHRDGLGMPRRAKVIALAMIAGVSLLSAVLIGWPWGLAVVALGAVGCWYVGLRVPTKERVLEARAQQG
jgi:uncharacterized protein